MRTWAGILRLEETRALLIHMDDFLGERRFDEDSLVDRRLRLIYVYMHIYIYI